MSVKYALHLYTYVKRIAVKRLAKTNSDQSLTTIEGSSRHGSGINYTLFPGKCNAKRYSSKRLHTTQIKTNMN